MLNNLSHLRTRLFNQPLMVQQSYMPALIGALNDRLNISQLSLPDGTEIDVHGLKAEAEAAPGRPSKPYRVNKGIAVVSATGSLVHRLGSLQPFSGMTGYDGINRQMQMAIADPDVKGILFDHNTPGGECAGAFALHDQLVQYAQQKPIWTMVDELSASAGYLLASATNRVVGPELAQVGSIGVITLHADFSQNLEEQGIKVTLIYQAAKKADGNPYEALPDDVRSDISSKINRYYSAFVSRVAAGRDLEQQAVIDTESAVYDAQQAIDVGLVDEVIPPEQVIDAFIDRIQSEQSTTIQSAEMNMSQEEQEKLLTKAKATSHEQGVKVGASKERERIKSILSCEQSQGRQELAAKLALETDNDLATCQMILESAPKSEAAAEKTEYDFKAAMKDAAPPAMSGDSPQTKPNAQSHIASWEKIYGEMSA